MCKFCRSIGSFIILASLCMLLTACGSGPSKADAEQAIDAMVKELATSLGAMLGNNNVNADAIPHVTVKDLKCTEAGKDTYDCAVLAVQDGQETQENISYNFV